MAARGMDCFEAMEEVRHGEDGAWLGGGDVALPAAGKPADQTSCMRPGGRLAPHKGTTYSATFSFPGDIRTGDFVLLVDCDTRVPADCMLPVITELLRAPRIAFTQHLISPMQARAVRALMRACIHALEKGCRQACSTASSRMCASRHCLAAYWLCGSMVPGSKIQH
jgi:hypothetical protein